MSTPYFLRLVAEHRLRATFFLWARDAHRSPGMVREIAAATTRSDSTVGRTARCCAARAPRTATSPVPATLSPRARGSSRRSCGTYGVMSTAAHLAAHRLGPTPVLWTCWGAGAVVLRYYPPAVVPTAVRPDPAGGGLSVAEEAPGVPGA
ncbi:hypothetical protein [Streptomyces sp. NPDC018610]|uniref:hypothetical protein n=1 Tax=Streptomyces sp. NPDC018610 TaxID=3365049 RepID=UPI00378AC074